MASKGVLRAVRVVFDEFSSEERQRIHVRFYDCLLSSPMWIVDHHLFIGFHNHLSQSLEQPFLYVNQAVGTVIGDMARKEFLDLWNDETLVKPLDWGEIEQSGWDKFEVSRLRADVTIERENKNEENISD
jgi:hypothetical protein